MATPKAYSYLRFSSPEQATGDSLRRQTAARDRWLAAHPRVVLDTSLKMTDAGRSAYKRTNPETYALTQFGRLATAGKIPKGSYLLVENLDRLSRESLRPALTLLLNLIAAGIKVVQLHPVEVVYDEAVDPMTLMMAVMEMSRGHSESAMKSERGRAVWGRKQREASAARRVSTRLPTWLSHTPAGVAPNAHADTVRRIYALACEGHSVAGIAATLNREGVPVMGRRVMKGARVRWADGTVRAVLTSRATVGEYVPYGATRGREKLPPVAGYYPAVVDEATYLKARDAMRTRAKVGRGRRGRKVNLLAGLLVDARTGGGMTYRVSTGYGTVIVPTACVQGRGGKWESFDAAELERGLLAQMRELTPADLEPEVERSGAVEALRGELAGLDAVIRHWTDQCRDLTLAAVVRAKLVELGAEREKLAARLADAEREAASPVRDALGDLRTLADVLDRDDSDDTRRKVQAALRRVVTRVRCVFAGKGSSRKRVRVATVRVEYAGGTMREYVLVHRRGRPLFCRSATGPADSTYRLDVEALEREYVRHETTRPGSQ